MLTRSRATLVLGGACVLVSMCCFVTAGLEPSLGRGAWLTALAGDWAVRINDGYEIGNSPQRGGTCTVYRVATMARGRGPSQQLTEAEVEDVREYASDNRYILLRTRDEFLWRPIGDQGGWRSGAAVPTELTQLRSLLAAPRPSRRPHFVVLGSAFAVGAMVIIAIMRHGHVGRHG